MTTMDERYKDGSDHEVCDKCGQCKDCSDCECDKKVEQEEENETILG